MRNSVIHVIELILGALLLGIGLLYLASQHRALSRLTDIIALRRVEDNNVFQQYNITNINQVSDEEVYASIMGYREYPIMIDDNIVPVNGYDYALYFSYIKDGNYKKEYQYNESKGSIKLIQYNHIIM